jgi:anti-anti-sigma regulatory factor
MSRKSQKTEPPPEGFRITVSRETDLWRICIAGHATMKDVARIRAARAQTETDTVPVLVVDTGVASIDTVAYGALAQWAQATRNRNVGWATNLALETAGRMFQMAGLPVAETVYPTEEAARQALDRGRAGLRVVKTSPGALALDGLRRK